MNNLIFLLLLRGLKLLMQTERTIVTTCTLINSLTVEHSTASTSISDYPNRETCTRGVLPAHAVRGAWMSVLKLLASSAELASARLPGAQEGPGEICASLLASREMPPGRYYY